MRHGITHRAAQRARQNRLVAIRVASGTVFDALSVEIARLFAVPLWLVHPEWFRLPRRGSLRARRAGR